MIQLDIEQKKFLDNLERTGKSFNTIKNYRTDLTCFNTYLLNKQKNLNINEFSQTQVMDYGEYIENKYNSVNSKRRRIQALRLFFDYLVSNGHFSENPIRKVVLAPKIVNLPTPVAFSDIYRIWNDLNSSIEETKGLTQLLNMRNKLLFYLIYGTGLKVSDIETLHFNHLLQDNSKEKNQLRVLISHPKRDPYTIPLPEGMSEYIEQYQEKMKIEMEKSDIEFTNFLFNANPFKILAGGLSARGCELIFKEINKKYDIKITPRNLRQSCIFKWINLGIAESTIKEWMGVLPSYSLKPYNDLIKQADQFSTFIELQELH